MAHSTPLQERINDVVPRLSEISHNVERLARGERPGGLTIERLLTEVAAQLDTCAAILEEGW